jgi:hypothetical protein
LSTKGLGLAFRVPSGQLRRQSADFRNGAIVVTPEQKFRNVKAFEDLVKVAALGGGPIAPLTAWFSLAPIQPTGGHWFFSFECPACRRASPLFRDFSEGHLGSPFRNCGVQAICYFCKANVLCASEGIGPIRWPLEPGQNPPKSEYKNRLARKYVDDPEYQPLSGLLHHYTSFSAFSSILKSRSLWATNIRYLEDSSESELGLARIRQVAEEARETSTGIDAEFLTYVIEWLSRPRSESASVYVLSFSKDHNKWGQWKSFTTYGQGICLSINSVLLVRNMQAQGWTFQNCRYHGVSQLTWADAILSRMRREAVTNDSGVEERRREGFDTIFRTCLPDLLQVAATIKHGAFVDESEVRFISPMIDIGDKRVSYRTRTGRKTHIPYVEFRLADDEGNVSIEEVMVGPGPEQDLVQSSVMTNLKENAVRAPWRVTLSDIPYRELP